MRRKIKYRKYRVKKNKNGKFKNKVVLIIISFIIILWKSINI